MTIEKRLLVVEIVGLAAVAASLFFVGIQIRQTQNIAGATMRLELATASQEVIFAFAEDPIAFAVATGLRDPDGEEILLRAQLLSRAVYRGYENYYHQYRKGFIDSVTWTGFRQEIERAMTSPFHRALWPKVRFGYSPAFRELVDGMHANTKS